VLQIIADPIQGKPTYHSSIRMTPDKKIILWQSDPTKLEVWHVSSGIQINQSTYLGSSNDCAMLVYKNRLNVLNAHPDLFKVSDRSTNAGVQIPGSPLIID